MPPIVAELRQIGGMKAPEAVGNVVGNVSSMPPIVAKLRQTGGMEALKAVGAGQITYNYHSY